MIETKKEVVIHIFGTFVWELKEHHGWRDIFSEHCSSRAEFSAAMDAYAIQIAERSDRDSPHLEPMDYAIAELGYKPKDAKNRFVVFDQDEWATEFADEASANRALSEKQREFGYELLTTDRGGHDGPTDHVDILHISATITVDGRVTEVKAASLDDLNLPDELAEDAKIVEAWDDAVWQFEDGGAR